MADLFESSLGDSHAPVAARMRPRTLGEYLGQESLLGPGKPLRAMVESRRPMSFILWAPPGVGKTSLARLVADHLDAEFVPFSAVSEGVPRIREIIKEAKERLAMRRRMTFVMVDEVHRLATNQQDALLGATEDGTIYIAGLTTENPSFHCNAALLSRARVYKLDPLTPELIAQLLERTLADKERGLGEQNVTIGPEALEMIASAAAGDARRALGALEIAASMAGKGGTITEELAAEATGMRYARHDKQGDYYYDLLRAFHKSCRGTNPHAAIYYFTRLLEAGSVEAAIRRLLSIAGEDVGMADPQALVIAQAAAAAYDRQGSPEGDIALAMAVIYVASAPKSNASYMALGRARAAVAAHPNAEIPLKLRNDSSKLMKSLGYKAGYRYAHDEPYHYAAGETYLPEAIEGQTFYRPGELGYEKKITQWFGFLRDLDLRFWKKD